MIPLSTAKYYAKTYAICYGVFLIIRCFEIIDVGSGDSWHIILLMLEVFALGIHLLEND